jgi:NAD+ kinase
MNHHTKIGLFGNHHLDIVRQITIQLLKKLHSHQMKAFVMKDFYEKLQCDTIPIPFHDGSKSGAYIYNVDGIIDQQPDLDIALSIGGDGTFLKTAALINKYHIPILGINTGRLGFLADVGIEQIDQTLADIAKGYYRTEERMMLQINSVEAIETNYTLALNEVAIMKRDNSSMITIHTYLNDEYLTSYWADGLLIATPTGSTAYSMSVNGPIVLPNCDNIVLSPVAPHSLNVRPLVIPGDYVIAVEVESRTNQFLISVDGQPIVVETKNKFSVKKSAVTTCVLKRYNNNFYQTLHHKLSWGNIPSVK